VDLYKTWKDGTDGHKNPCDTYGAEHLCRLLGMFSLEYLCMSTSKVSNRSPVSLPELLAQTNMDQQSVNRLREELVKLTTWLGDNYTKYFVPNYDTPSQEYKDLAN
jgi:mortality factor 4-like protein 1